MAKFTHYRHALTHDHLVDAKAVGPCGNRACALCVAAITRSTEPPTFLTQHPAALQLAPPVLEPVQALMWLSLAVASLA